MTNSYLEVFFSHKLEIQLKIKEKSLKYTSKPQKTETIYSKKIRECYAFTKMLITDKN